VSEFGFRSLKTKGVIREKFESSPNERGSDQGFGDVLDRRTGGAWVRDSIRNLLLKDGDAEIALVVDAVRILPQIDAIRKAYGARVVHVHLTAPKEVLDARYAKRNRAGDRAMPSYDDVLKNKTERKVEELMKFADIAINTDRCSEMDVLVRTAAALGVYDRERHRLVDVLVGGQYGSEGKGHIAAYLSTEYDLLVRVGGPNAGHQVYEEEAPFTFHQLPSGTRSSEARLLIGPGAVINPTVLQDEIAKCGIDKNRLSIDPQAMIILPSDRAKERRVVDDIGSTGQGVGAATVRRISDRGKRNVKMAGDVPAFEHFIRPAYRVLEEAFAQQEKILLEGTQGTGLSLYHGEYPYVTSRDTTVAGCLAEAGISPLRVRKVIMVCRTYPIRVANPDGAEKTSGGFSKETSWSEVADRAKLNVDKLIATEKTSTTKRDRRVGEFDWDLLHKATSLNNPTDIALTFTDYLSAENLKAHRFEQLHEETLRFIQEVEQVTSARVSLISTGFNSRSIIDRRLW
jgi:adenylosuccinate synthase